MSASGRLAALELELPTVATPVGSYLPARRIDNLAYTSGQLPLVSGELITTGVVGGREGDVSPEIAAECARVSVLNAIAAAASVTDGVDSIVGIVKMTGFIASAPGFTGQPGILNAASEILGEVFGDSGRHARSAVGVAALPLGAPIEIELIAQVRPL